MNDLETRTILLTGSLGGYTRIVADEFNFLIFYGGEESVLSTTFANYLQFRKRNITITTIDINKHSSLFPEIGFPKGFERVEVYHKDVFKFDGTILHSDYDALDRDIRTIFETIESFDPQPVEPEAAEAIIDRLEGEVIRLKEMRERITFNHYIPIKQTILDERNDQEECDPTSNSYEHNLDRVEDEIISLKEVVGWGDQSSEFNRDLKRLKADMLTLRDAFDRAESLSEVVLKNQTDLCLRNCGKSLYGCDGDVCHFPF